MKSESDKVSNVAKKLSDDLRALAEAAQEQVSLACLIREAQTVKRLIKQCLVPIQHLENALSVARQEYPKGHFVEGPLADISAAVKTLRELERIQDQYKHLEVQLTS